MKKLLILVSISIVLTITTASTFGQATFWFSGTIRSVWDDTLNTPTLDGNFDAVFLVGPVGEAPLVSSIMNGTPANTADFFNPTAAAWQDVLNDPNFTIAGTSTGGTMTDYIAPGNANGGFAYNSSPSAPEVALTGTTPGTTYALIVVAWNTGGGLNTTPQEAAAAGAPIGWSPVFDYVAGNPLPATPPFPMNPTSFGIWPAPEPTTLALAGLGGISMILIRRSKG